MGKQRKIKLKSVTIRGFKSIAYEHPVTLEMGDVSILLGANGAGKSNVISFFKMLGYMMSQSFERYVELSGTSSTILHKGPKITSKIDGELKFETDNAFDTYQFQLTNATPNRLIFIEEKINITWIDKQKNPYEKLLNLNLRESALIDNQSRDTKYIYRMLSSCKVYQFNDSTMEGPLRQVCPIDTSNYLQTNGNNLSSFLLLLKNNYTNAYRRIVHYVRDVVPQFQDFYLEPMGNTISLKWMDNSPNDYVYGVHQFSDGSIRFIALATLLLQPEELMPNVIIIDEPELGLHPYAIAQLTEMIKDASLHSQIIISTQSKDLVDYFDIENISVVEMDKENLYTTIQRLKKEDLKVWLEDYTLSELWDKNVIGGRPV